MRFLVSIISVLTASVFYLQAQDIAKGYIFEDSNGNGKKDRTEKGIPDVAVSDGQHMTLTDGNGYYEFAVNNHCVIFAIKPKGYIFPVNDRNQPQFYYIHKPDGSPDFNYKGSAPTGPLPSSLDFPMLKYDDPEKFSFFAFGDPQPYSKKEVEYFRKLIVEEANDKDGMSFGISLGDVVGDHLDLQPYYLDAIKDMGLPWYNTIGNHDRNYDATEEKYVNETFESNFGPSTYAFRYGDTHFLILDDIFMHLAPKTRPYKGGFSEEQFEFIENYLKLVEKGQLVILAYHIPIAYKTDQFIDSHRRRLFKLLEGHNVFALSAHTHFQTHFFVGDNYGWLGEKRYHEYNVGTSNGDWYSGILDNNGLPDAMMRDGTPPGYAIITVDGSEYSCRYKVARMPDEYQISIYCPEYIPYKKGGKFPVYANFFIGSANDEVEFRIDNGKWNKMIKSTEEADPTFLNKVFQWDNTDSFPDGRRPNSIPVICPHLWKAFLDNTLEPGTHSVEIRAKDMFGNVWTAKNDYIIVSDNNEKQD